MFGIRQDEDGRWALCERRGRLINRVSSLYPIRICFPDRRAAEECANELNELFWPDYRERRRATEGQELRRAMVETIGRHGGLGNEVIGEREI